VQRKAGKTYEQRVSLKSLLRIGHLKEIRSLIFGLVLAIVGIIFLGDLILFAPVFLGRRYEWSIPLERYLMITFISLPLTFIGLMGGYAMLRKWFRSNYRKTV
jgi:hypothetical protein